MDRELLDTMIQTLLPLIATALGTMLIALTTYYTNLIRQRVKSEQLTKYLDLLNETVTDVVVSLNQTTVEQLKAASQDGKLTVDEIKCIREDAMTTVINILGVSGIEVLKLTFDDIEALIANKIERTVKTEKTKEG